MVAQIDRAYIRAAGRLATIRRAVSYALFEGRPATTKGQWFNPVVGRNLAWGDRHGSSAGLDRPIFIVGVGRSGTTHLGRLLSAHPAVGWLNEPKMIWNHVLPGEDISGFYSDSGRFVLEASDVNDETRLRANRVLNYYLHTVRAGRLVDKYPEMTYRIPFIRAMFPDAHIVAIVRRPEDVVNSIVDWNAEHAHGDEDWWGVRRRKWAQMVDQLAPAQPDVARAVAGERLLTSSEMAAAEWVLGMRAIGADIGSLSTLVRYEDLAREPVTTMSRVLAACELAPDPRVLELTRLTTSGRLRSDPADFGVMSDAVEKTRLNLDA